MQESRVERDSAAGGLSSEIAGRFVREVTATLDSTERLQRGVEIAVDVIPRATHAGVSVLTRAGVQTDAATSAAVWCCDQIQYDLAEGPCLDAAVQRATYASRDVAADRRWARWGPAVAQQVGVRSVLSVALFTASNTVGALNLYADETDAFSVDDIAVVETLGAFLAVAWADGCEIEQRGVAMRTRTIIGQAEGILMARYHIRGDRAFEVLRRISQNSNKKLVALARELTETGQLEGLQPPDH